MKFLWLEDDIETITSFNLKKVFGIFILNRYEEDMKGNIDEIDEKLQDINEGIDYTSNHENWIRDTSKEVLAELKTTSLNELFELYVTKKDRNFYSKLGEIPESFLLEHITNRDLSQEFVGKADEDIDIMRGVKEITNSQILEKIKSLYGSKLGNEYVKLDFDEEKNKLIIELKYNQPEPNLEVLGTENFSFKKYSRPKTIVNTSKVNDVKLDKKFIEEWNKEHQKKKDFLEEVKELTREETKEQQLKDFEDKKREMKDKKISKQEGKTPKKIIEDYFLSENSPLFQILPEQLSDPYNLYDLHLTVEFRFDKIGEVVESFEIDEREFLTEEIKDKETGEVRIEETEPNPNFEEPKLDDEGNKIPIHDDEELGNYIEVKVNINLKEMGSYVFRQRKKETSPYNRARDAYVKHLKNRVGTLEDAIEDIPSAGN